MAQNMTPNNGKLNRCTHICKIYEMKLKDYAFYALAHNFWLRLNDLQANAILAVCVYFWETEMI